VGRLVFRTAGFSLVAASVAAGASAQSSYTRSTVRAPIAPVVHVYADDEIVLPEVLGIDLPANVTIADGYLVWARSMLLRSPTFRRQCARLAAARHLSVTVQPALLPGGGRPDQAVTRITFGPDGSIQAEVNIGSMGDPLELVPHEFEHVLEQLDGVDLVSMAGRRDTGVRGRRDGEPFETERAIAVGRQVAREVRESGRHGGG
jgi:hypothetical protein